MTSDRSASWARLVFAAGQLPQPWLENNSITTGRAACSGTFMPPFCAEAAGATTSASAAQNKLMEKAFIPSRILAGRKTHESRRREPVLTILWPNFSTHSGECRRAGSNPARFPYLSLLLPRKSAGRRRGRQPPQRQPAAEAGPLPP